MTLILAILASIGLAFTLCWGWVLLAIENNVPGIIIGVVGIFIGFYIPGTILRWIYKEEIAKLESERSEDK